MVKISGIFDYLDGMMLLNVPDWFKTQQLCG